MVEAGFEDSVARRCLKKADNRLDAAMEFAMSGNYADVTLDPVRLSVCLCVCLCVCMWAAFMLCVMCCVCRVSLTHEQPPSVGPPIGPATNPNVPLRTHLCVCV